MIINRRRKKRVEKSFQAGWQHVQIIEFIMFLFYVFTFYIYNINITVETLHTSLC